MSVVSSTRVTCRTVRTVRQLPRRVRVVWLLSKWSAFSKPKAIDKRYGLSFGVYDAGSWACPPKEQHNGYAGEARKRHIAEIIDIRPQPSLQMQGIVHQLQGYLI